MAFRSTLGKREGSRSRKTSRWEVSTKVGDSWEIAGETDQQRGWRRTHTLFPGGRSGCHDGEAQSAARSAVLVLGPSVRQFCHRYCRRVALRSGAAAARTRAEVSRTGRCGCLVPHFCHFFSGYRVDGNGSVPVLADYDCLGFFPNAAGYLSRCMGLQRELKRASQSVAGEPIIRCLGKRKTEI